MAGRYYEEYEIDRKKSISNYTVELTNEAVNFIQRKGKVGYSKIFVPGPWTPLLKWSDGLY